MLVISSCCDILTRKSEPITALWQYEAKAVLKTFVDLDFTALSGNPFHCETTLFEKKTCLEVNALVKSFLDLARKLSLYIIMQLLLSISPFSSDTDYEILVRLAFSNPLAGLYISIKFPLSSFSVSFVGPHFIVHTSQNRRYFFCHVPGPSRY